MRYRAEDKFCCSRAEMYLLQRKLEAVLRADSNEENQDGYSIVSLYFDDLEDTCYYDTADGAQVRNKYRIRIYNHSLETIKLEVKEKKDNRIHKKSKTISEAQMQRLLGGECIEESYSPEDPATLFNAAIRMRGLRPKIIVAYERKAFVYEPGNVRITLDRNVRGSLDVMHFGNPDLVYEGLREQDSVLEVKYDELIPGFLLQLLELGNLQQSAFSKYQLCREENRCQ